MTLRGPLAVVIALALLLSLATNLLVVGFVGGRFFGPHFGPPPGPGGEIERIVAIGARAFPPKIRDNIGKLAEGERDDMHARFDAVQEARQRMYAAMRADPFDRAAVEAAFADLTAKTDALQAAGQEIVLKALEQATPAERARIRPSHGPFP